MSDEPRVQYARSGPVHIASMSYGEGPEDIVVTPGATSSVETFWPTYREMLGAFDGVARVTWFDKRGTGLSDREANFTFEERMDDIRAVMDAQGIHAAHLVGVSEGGPMSILFAATYPDRVKSLVLYGTFPSWRRRADYPEGTGESLSGYLEYVNRMVSAHMGDLDGIRWWRDVFAPSLPEHEAVFRAIQQGIARTASPGSARAIWEGLYEIDVRQFLASIQVPTTVIHSSGDRVIPVAGGRYLARHIPGARFVELAGDDHYPGPMQAMTDAIRENLALSAGATASTTRRLSTVLFSDIVSSTDTAVRSGDDVWRRRLDSHDAAAASVVRRYGGTVVKSTGDGILATFEGPSSGIRAGLALHASMQELDLAIRVGLHTGEIESRGADVAGIGVHVASRVSGFAGPLETLVSSTVKDLTFGSGFAYTDRGAHALKGIPGEWTLYAVSA
jgi:pimeloyl-ACP methyl ester carboxylesterase/class 3 adenylate cyclase